MKNLYELISGFTGIKNLFTNIVIVATVYFIIVSAIILLVDLILNGSKML